MSSAIAVDRCPFPGCALESEHGGDHVPRYRLVQRFAWFEMGLPESQARNCDCVWPGHCDLCDHTAAALYATHEGEALALCQQHEKELFLRGPAELLKGGAA